MLKKKEKLECEYERNEREQVENQIFTAYTSIISVLSSEEYSVIQYNLLLSYCNGGLYSVFTTKMLLFVTEVIITFSRKVYMKKISRAEYVRGKDVIKVFNKTDKN